MDASTPPAPGRPPVLLVTVRAELRVEGAERASSAREGLALWHRGRQPAVLADFGALADGTTGVRLARLLRRASPAVHIALLCDAPDPSRLSWARANGADAVLERSARAVAAWLHPPPPPHGGISEALRARLVRALQVQGRVGPAAALMVDDAIDEWTRTSGGRAAACAPALVELLARRIRHAPAQASFRQCLDEEIRHHALV